MTRHHIKCTKPVFNLIASGRKTAEVRLNDRLYQTGDIVVIYEGTDWDKGSNGALNPAPKPYFPPPSTASLAIEANRVAIAEILSIVNGGQFGIECGYVLLSFSKFDVVTYDKYINNSGA